MSKSICLRIFVLPTLLLFMASSAGFAQPADSDNAPATQPDKPPLKPEELEQLLAPIALYPDSLVTQMLMASTYPLEIVEADRWAKANKDLKGDALATELEKQPWDPSVKSLVNFPDQLSVMSEKLDVTIKIGDAFIGQQQDVLNTVQILRSKAQASGNLKSNDQMKVDVQTTPLPSESASPTAQPAQVTVVQAPPQVITIESSSPQVVYVPTYNPTVVYGAWPYPAYPPYPYYPPRPPGYVATAAISFGVGVACGAAWGYAWGHCNWGGGGHSSININVNQNVNFNKNINRSNYQNNYNRNNANFKGGSGTWQHNPAHRDGVPYRDQKSTQQFGGANTSRQATQAREQYRGRADAGRQDLANGGADQFKGNQGNSKTSNANNRAGNAAANKPGANGGGLNRDNTAANRPGANGGGTRDNTSANRPGANGGGTRDNAAAANRPTNSGANRSGSSGSQSSAFDGVDRGGSNARADSQRGAASRSGSSAGASRSGGGGAAKGGGGGGGGARGGGGGRR